MFGFNPQSAKVSTRRCRPVSGSSPRAGRALNASLSAAGLLVLMVALIPVGVFGCRAGESVNWLKNGLLDPTQVGNFDKPASNEIRESISILEEPTGVQDAEEPQAEDLAPWMAEERINPGDVLTVSIFELLMPGVATGLQLRAGNSGFETLPVLGPVKVAGLTPRELELEIKSQLREAQILDDADVQVTIVQSQTTQFSVLGQVPRAGTFPLTRPDVRLMEALALAGGVPPQIETIYVMRALSGDEARASSDFGLDIPEAADETSVEEPVTPLVLSDASRGSAGWSQDPSRREGPPTTESSIDELDILEGEAPGQAPSVYWDSARREWVTRPSAAEAPAGAPTAAAAVASQTEAATEGTEQAPAEAASAAPASEPETSIASAPESRRGAATTRAEGAPAEEQAPAGMQVPVRIIEIPVAELMDGDPRYNLVVRPYDVISVPAGSVGEFYLGGNVARPGAYSLTGRRITVKQAIVSAGGFGPLAWPSRAELVRRIGQDEEQMIQLDLDAIFAGKAPDFFVKPNDIVNVGSTPVAVFMAVLRNAFRFSYGMGFVYDRNFGDSDTFTAKEQIRARERLERQAKGLPI